MRNRDINKEQVIRKKALKMIVKQGFDGFSMQKLAKAAGVSPGTLYIYFKSKEDLIYQLCITEGLKFSEATLKDFDPAMSFKDGLRVQWLNRAKYCLKHPEEVYFLEQIKHSSMQEKAVKAQNEHFRDVMIEFVTNAIKRKELAKVPLEVFWSIAYAPLYNLIRFHKTGHSVGGHKFEFSEEVMMHTLELVTKALKPGNETIETKSPGKPVRHPKKRMILSTK
jgi:TetR/AcrR family transcriptional repressor of multidrug resistance operon